MAFKPAILKGAQIDYAQIIDYLMHASGGIQAASRFADDFDAQMKLTCENPFVFAVSKMPELSVRGYRTFFVNNYIALYKVVDDLVVIAHIFHLSQDYAKLL